VTRPTDLDAQCPTHGCARWRCDADHPGEVAYGGLGAYEHDDGDLYKRVRSAEEAFAGTGGKFYKLVEESK
jgi:hypothetical protein